MDTMKKLNDRTAVTKEQKLRNTQKKEKISNFYKANRCVGMIKRFGVNQQHKVLWVCLT